MSSATPALLAALLGDLVDGNSAALTPWLTERLRGLPTTLVGEVWQAVKTYPPGLDLAEVLTAPPDPDAPPRFTVYSAADALQPQPPVAWVIEGLFSAGSLSLIVGAAGSKKTYACLSALVCVAAGKPWLGRAVAQAPVLMVDEESGPRRLARRLSETLWGELEDPTPPPDLFYTALARFDPRQPLDMQALEDLIRARGCKLVLLDALADIMPGADENAVKDTQPVFMALRALADATGAALVLIHHANKNGGYRGSTAISGAVDLMLKVESEPASSYITFTSEKTRDVEPFAFTAEAVFDAPGGRFYLQAAAPQSPTAHLSDSKAYVLRYLSAQEKGTALLTDIQAHADTCSPEAARRAVYSLAKEGRVERADGGGAGVPAAYRLKQGQDDADP